MELLFGNFEDGSNMIEVIKANARQGGNTLDEY
jgi:hypothetical protein